MPNRLGSPGLLPNPPMSLAHRLARASAILFFAAFLALPTRAGDPAPAPTLELDAALAQVLAARSLDPDDPVALERLADICGQKGDVDGQIAYLISALGALDELEVDDAKQKDANVKRVTAALAKLDAASSPLKSARDAYLKDLTWALDLYNKTKKTRNALDVAGQILAYRPSHRMAAATAASVLAEAKDDVRTEALRLLGTGELRRPRAFLADWRKSHSDWKDAGSLETDGYIIRTNIGYDTLQFAGIALEHLASFYRRFYDHDASIQKKKTIVELYRTRREFETHSDKSMDTANPGLKGFLVFKGMLEVAANGTKRLKEADFSLYSYDPRDEARPLAAIYETLSHEASHQYMRLATGQMTAPPWLDEGMASFFEGAVIRDDGEVLVGLPARTRLMSLIGTLDAIPNALSETLAAQGALSGEFYPVAWGLVYYLDQLTSEDGSRPFQKKLRDAPSHVRKGVENGRELFETAILAGTGLDLPAFERQWIAAMRELRDLESNPEKAADHYLERGFRLAARGAWDAALEDFERVRIYRQSDARALLAIARYHQRTSAKSRSTGPEKDVTLLWSRRAHRAATLSADATTEKEAAEIAKQADPGGFDKIAQAEARYRREVQRQITRQVEAGRPRTALALASHWQDRVLGDQAAAALVSNLRTKSGFEVDRTFAPFDGSTMLGLACSPSHYSVDGGEVVCRVERPERGALSIERLPSPRFRFEGEVWLADPDVSASMYVELPWNQGLHGFVARAAAPKDHPPLPLSYPPFDMVEPGKLAPLGQGVDKRGFLDLKLDKASIGPSGIAPKQWVRFVLARESLDALTLSIGEKEVGRIAIDGRDNAPRIGVIFFGGEGRLRNLRIVEKDRL